MSYLDSKTITLTPQQLGEITTTYELLDPIGENQFYDVNKIILKLKYNTTPYTLNGNIYFEIDGERISIFQPDSINSVKKVVTISNTLLCKDICSPILNLGKNLTMRFENNIPPVNGDSEVELTVYYTVWDF
jgi:hypothetical protein